MVPSLIMLHLYDKVPPESNGLIREKLKKLDKIALAKFVIALPSVKLFNVSMVFWVGSVILGVFGVGRFMIGDRLIGALKVTLMFFSYILLALSTALTHFVGYESFSVILMIVGFVGLLCVVIWWGIDIFLIVSKTRKENLNKILMLFNL